jgi:hypothetical protein
MLTSSGSVQRDAAPIDDLAYGMPRLTMVAMRLVATTVLLLAACGDDGGTDVVDAQAVSDASRQACTGDYPAAEGAACDSECVDSDLFTPGPAQCTARYQHNGVDKTFGCPELFSAGGRTGCCVMDGPQGERVVHFAACD